MVWLYYSAGFIIFWLLRYIYFWSKSKSLKKSLEQYRLYVNRDENTFIERKQSIIELFKEAGIKNFSVPHYEMVGMGHGFRHSLDGFENMNKLDDYMIGVMRIKFREATGTFSHQAKQSLNPIFWLEFIVRLPQRILSYLNISPSDSIMKIIQVIYWLTMLLLGLNAAKLIDLNSIF